MKLYFASEAAAILNVDVHDLIALLRILGKEKLGNSYRLNDNDIDKVRKLINENKY